MAAILEPPVADRETVHVVNIDAGMLHEALELIGDAWELRSFAQFRGVLSDVARVEWPRVDLRQYLAGVDAWRAYSQQTPLPLLPEFSDSREKPNGPETIAVIGVRFEITNDGRAALAEPRTPSTEAATMNTKTALKRATPQLSTPIASGSSWSATTVHAHGHDCTAGRDVWVDVTLERELDEGLAYATELRILCRTEIKDGSDEGEVSIELNAPGTVRAIVSALMQLMADPHGAALLARVGTPNTMTD